MIEGSAKVGEIMGLEQQPCGTPLRVSKGPRISPATLKKTEREEVKLKKNLQICQGRPRLRRMRARMFGLTSSKALLMSKKTAAV